MEDTASRDRVALLNLLIRKLFGPEGWSELAPGQIAILHVLREAPSSLAAISERLGAHEAIVARSLVSLERKGLIVSDTGRPHAFRLTAVAHAFLDPAACEHLADVLASSQLNDQSSIETMVTALLGELPVRL